VNARQQDLGASGGEAIGARALRGLNSFPSVLAGPSVHYACRDFDRRRSGRRCSPFTHTGSQRQETWGDFDCQQDFGAAHLVGSRAYSSLPTDRVTASIDPVLTCHSIRPVRHRTDRLLQSRIAPRYGQG
jgi:hypothetical protein